MKKISQLIITVFLLIAGILQAQDFAQVDALVKQYPKSFKSAEALGDRVAADFKREDEKARALFTWIAYNIQYNTDPAALGRKPVRYTYSSEEERLRKIAEIENELSNETLKKKKAVCHGYSMVYTLAARRAGLECELIYGTAKSRPQDIGKLPGNSNHAWNAVKINGQWKLLDVTWGAGGMMGGSRAFNFNFDDKYFAADPDMFFLNHFPDDKKWLLTDKKEQDFAELPLYYDLGYQLIQPDFGVVKASGSGLMPFRIKGIQPTDEVAYQFTSSKFSNRVTPTFNDGVAEFNVMIGKGGLGTLTIFVNKVSVAAYKLVR
jgi:hypothetical protein